MTQEEKSLLLKDLCARLPYGVKMSVLWKDKRLDFEKSESKYLIGTLDAVYPSDERIIVDDLNESIAPVNVRCGGFTLDESNFKPYLRPMSSMTEEEKIESLEFALEDDYGRLASYNENIPKYIDWLNKKMFDYRKDDENKTMIEKGLALEAPIGMYNN